MILPSIPSKVWSRAPSISMMWSTVHLSNWRSRSLGRIVGSRNDPALSQAGGDRAVLARAGSMRDRIAMYNTNALKIGIFGANCSSGRSATTVPERWSASWPDCLRLARMADAAGIDFMLPIGRWTGYGGHTDFHGSTLETVTWAVGLLGATRRITVFGTVHAPLFHPLIAAKEFVTADHVGEGRFGVNLVVGWNEGEFEMFGVTQREHDARYAFAQEWLDVVKRAWSERGNFDFHGEFLDLKGVRAYPKPYGETRPIIMNAGSMFRANALYEGAYLLGTSIARPLIAKRQLETAEKVGADAVAHGATGKGNDQVRFEIGYYALAPDIKVIAPWREWDLTSRTRLLDYADQHQIPIARDKRGEAPFSVDANLLHISAEGKVLEDPWVEPEELVFSRTVAPEAAPDQPQYVEITFERGDPVAVDGEALAPAALMTRLNEIGGKHGIG